MAEIHRLPDAEQVEREASEWIARLGADDVSEEDRLRFEAWRSAHPRHARAHEELAATWKKYIDAGRLVRAVNLGQSLEASTQKAIQESTSVGGAEGRFTAKRFALTAAAAIAALAIGAGWLFLNQQPRTLFQTAIGERASIELPDGSSLELNSNSRVRVNYAERARIMRLERGEAFFQVAHDATRPFWVGANGSWVRAVGTAFNVHVLPAGVRVLVSEGTVKVAASAASGSGPPSEQQLAHIAVSVLKAGQQVDVQGSAAKIRSLPPVELARSMSWRSGTVHFERERLARVVNELSRYTTLQVIIDDDALRDLQVGGTFQTNAQGTEALLMTLQDGFGLQVRRDGRVVHVTSNDR